MPKKMGINDKAAAAREREESKKQADKAAKEKAKEDAEWAAAGEGSKTKAQAKKDEAEKKKQEAAAKKAELKRLEEEEAAALSKPKSTKTAKVSEKVTRHQLDQQKAFEAKLKEQQLKEKELAAKREVSEDSYGKLVETENTNREEDVIEARSVEAALQALGVDDTPDADKHPEKRVRVAWLAYCERELPVLKQDKPGLRQNQYKDMLWKQWQKSPENPINAAALSQGK